MFDNHSLTQKLLDNLKHSEESIREKATAKLWMLWFRQKGEIGLETLRRAQNFLENGNIQQAHNILNDTIAIHPDFAEAWNRRAILYYSQRKFLKSREDCKQVVRLNPSHFGAWHGLGLCHAALGEYKEAIFAFKKALAIQPHALVNQKLILECTMRL
ncbi:MAG: tetratricopeptide repeat protein [Cyanobacteria bacterium SBLK]|nr:tetratricopeptide repeat protein [Cyanobacteria bacterium SBLK]